MDGIKIRVALILTLVAAVFIFVFSHPETTASANENMRMAIARYEMAKPHQLSSGVWVSDQPGTYKAYVVQLLENDIARSPRLLTDESVTAACDIAGDYVLGGMPDNLKGFCSLR